MKTARDERWRYYIEKERVGALLISTKTPAPQCVADAWLVKHGPPGYGGFAPSWEIIDEERMNKENRGYRSHELRQPARHWRWGVALGMVIVAAFVLAVAFAAKAHADGEAVTVQFACATKAVAKTVIKSRQPGLAMDSAVAQDLCREFEGKPAVLGRMLETLEGTMGGRTFLFGLSEVYFDRNGKPWYVWGPVSLAGATSPRVP